MMDTKTLKDMAKKFGADLVGIASMDRFASVPADQNPLSIFPQAKSMIVVGRKIPFGTMRAVEQSPANAASYDKFGLFYLEDQFLAKTTYDLSVWVETEGYEAVPMFGYDAKAAARQPLGAPVAEDKPAPNVYVDWMFAAQAAGLGEIGKNGLFLTPEYGPCQRLAMLVSDFEFTPDPAFAPRLCHDCQACIDACPLQAFEPEVTTQEGLTGAETAVAQRHEALCAQCKNGAIQTNFGRFNTIDRIAAACGRACLAALTERGQVSKFKGGSFRSAPTWAVDLVGRKINA
ncbi:MAG: hypothetical protein PHC30_08845 [Lentisphaeria bacterium]|nr:hypothetical protein [Lentisphaeria bacterium]